MKQERRESAKKRLEQQLSSGVKKEKVSKLTLATTGANDIPLDENDVKRINKELTILKDRLAGVKKVKKQKNE